MSMQSEGKDAKGRNYDQVTRDGTSSAGSMGAGGTGDIGAMGSDNPGSQQSASRTDDLLAGDTTHQEADQAFSGGSQGGQIQTGMEGIGKRSGGAGASQQSGQQSSQQSSQQAGQQGSMPSGQTDADQYDQGTAPRE
ncbi:hypothetical protein [Massilia sp. BSC265]|uniref:hypothetical protein n=1 Tax=Massilia sp. BSC265 TaxID=1549812 RepID=UPI0004E8BA00|nr:hypothetical protein [Massilia sp. BSC265]KFI07552.1 hypothetical protein JN27_08135 [Massilia sp. BSC265]